MRVLITIPHFFNPDGDGRYASTRPDARPRVAALTHCLRALHTTYTHPQELWYRDGDRLYASQANDDTVIDLTVVVCTSSNLHALSQLTVPSASYTHRATDCAPMMLGFECHKVMHEARGNYELYGYLEDDMLLHDPYFFAKLNWFADTVGQESVLQPNRYERAFLRTAPTNDAPADSRFKKVYIDFEFRPEAEVIDKAGEPITVPFLDRTIALRRTTNPHAACFFLTAGQMQHWSQQADFLSGDTSYVGPLESAASLGLYRNFKVYKPAPANASYLEIEHYGQMWSQRLGAVRFGG